MMLSRPCVPNGWRGPMDVLHGAGDVDIMRVP